MREHVLYLFRVEFYVIVEYLSSPFEPHIMLESYMNKKFPLLCPDVFSILTPFRAL